MSTAKHRFLAVLASLLVGALMSAAFAAGHPLDATDLDHDGFKNWADNCPENHNPKQLDTDKDTVAPVVNQPQPHPSTGPVIVYPYTPAVPGGAPAPTPTDRTPDTGGDSCDNDDDGDGITDSPKRDNCPLKPNKDQTDSDFDGKGDLCDTDDDNDDARDADDNCPLISNAGQADSDKDGIGDACDPDAPKAATTALGGPNPNDKSAPKVAISGRRVLRFDELGRGLAVGIRCDEGCSLDGELLVRGKAISRGAAQIESKGNTWVFLTFGKGALKRATKLRRTSATFKLVAKDANGNRVVVQKRLTLRP